MPSLHRTCTCYSLPVSRRTSVRYARFLFLAVSDSKQLPDNECIPQVVLLYSSAGSLGKLFG